MNKSKSTMAVVTLTVVSLLGAVAFLLTFLGFPIPPFPGFLKLEMSSIAAIVASAVFGPVAGVAVELIKNTIDFFAKPVGAGVGQLANFVVSAAYIIPFGLIFRKYRKNAGFICAAVTGAVCMTVVACLANYFVLVPLYAKIMGVDIQAFVDMTQKGIESVKDFKTLIVFAFAPFNIIKAILMSIVGFILVKALDKPMKRMLPSNAGSNKIERKENSL